jgi:hypothetical protein
VDAEELGGDEVPQLVNEDDDAEDEDGCGHDEELVTGLCRQIANHA